MDTYINKSNRIKVERQVEREIEKERFRKIKERNLWIDKKTKR